MNKSENLNPIEGEFTHEEVKEILMNLYTSKINFLNIKSWSSLERFGKNDNYSEMKIIQLRSEIEKIRSIINEAELQNKNVKISSSINISILE